jgi:hypothetical protein
VGRVDLLQRADAEQLAVAAGAVERDGRTEEPAHVEGVDVLGWAVLVGERQVPGHECLHIGRSWVVGGDDEHESSL